MSEQDPDAPGGDGGTGTGIEPSAPDTALDGFLCNYWQCLVFGGNTPRKDFRNPPLTSGGGGSSPAGPVRMELSGLCFKLETGEGDEESCILVPVFENCGKCEYFDPKTKTFVEIEDATQLVSKDGADMNTPWFATETGLVFDLDGHCHSIFVRSRMSCGELIEKKGYFDPATCTFEELPMSAEPRPGKELPKEFDKVDLTPLKVEGPADAATISDLFADALAVSEATAFPDEGSDIVEEDVAKCGSVSIVELNGHKGVILNGLVDHPVGAWNDVDGINMTNTIGVAAGCCILVTFCARKQYTPPKAPAEEG